MRPIAGKRAVGYGTGERRPMREGNPLEPNTRLCEEMLSPYNLEVAVQNVKRNKGSAGVDGMRVEELDAFMRDGWPRIREQILARKYKPKPVKRVEIPKDNGGVRLLGVPCVVDRVIQQAMVQVLTPVFEPTFSDFSYGFRPNRSAEDAVRKAQEYMAEGYNHVVDLDLSKFFDTVNHDLLMTFVDRTLEDKDIRRLIFSYLKSGVMTDGSFHATEEGTPQGGPLSPMLANIYLTPYDKELEKRGLRFVRYADDCNVFTRSKYSCRRVKDSIIRFLEGRMKLKVNMDKTEARTAVGSSFLGFTFTTLRGRKGSLGYCRPKQKKLDAFTKRVREILKRNRGVSIKIVISELNAYIRGWINYYARSNISGWLTDKASWIRRKVWCYLYKQWKTKENRIEKLKEMGASKHWLMRWAKGLGNRGYWKMSKIVATSITVDRFYMETGLIDIMALYKRQHSERMMMDKCRNSQLEFIFD